MIQTLRRQSGITVGGLLFILAVIGVIVLFGVRAFPLYNEKMQVVAAMKTVSSNPEAAGMSDREVAMAFLKNIDATTNIRRFSERNLKEQVEVVKGESKGDPKQLRVHFDATNVLYKDLHLMLRFDVSMPLRGNPAGTGE
jgi:hypothetical protein